MKNVKKFKTVGLLSAMMAVSFTAGVGLLTVQATEDAGSYYLMPGASVTILTDEIEENESTYFSLDYTAVVDEAFYTANLKDKEYVLGVVIAPEKGEAITLDTAKVANVCYVGSSTLEGVTATPNFDNGAYTFTASIVYNTADIVAEYNAVAEPDLTKEEILKKVAKLELSARPYYKVGSEAPVYGEATVTRSIKNVLNEVVLRGQEATGVEIPEEIQSDFIGTATTVDGEYYLDATTGELLQYANGALDNVTKAELGTVDSYVLAGKTVTPVTGDEVTFALADMPTAKGGNVRGVTLVNGEGTRNIKATVVTKVLRDQADFKEIRLDDKYATTPVAHDVDGYYLLGNDITFEWRNGGSLGTSWKAYGSNLNETANAFTGTFDGLGYTLSGMVVCSGGVFGNLRGATVQNVAFVDTYMAYPKQDRMVLATNVIDTLVKNVYIQMRDIDETKTDAFWNASTSGGILAGTKAHNSTYQNVIVDMRYDYSAYGGTGLGAMPLFGHNTDNTNTITDVYAITEQPYKFRIDNGVLTVEYGANLLEGTGIQVNTEYVLADVATGDNEALKKFASYATTVYTSGQATKIVFSNVLTANDGNPKQYASLKDMSKVQNSLTTFDSNYWTVEANAVTWNSQVGDLYDELTEAWEGEFYLEQATGELLLSDSNGNLQPVAKAQLGTLSKIMLGNDVVTFSTGDNVAFTADDLTAQTVGQTANIMLIGEGMKKIQATYITKALKQASDLAVFASGTANAGYYVLANSFDCQDYTHTHAGNSAFNGTFDGRGHAISGFVAGSGGLFKSITGTSTQKAVIKNVAFKDFNFSVWSKHRGLLGGWMQYVAFENIYASYSESIKKTHTRDGFGGMISSDAVWDSSFTNVILYNPHDVSIDAIGVMRGDDYNNTYDNFYLISEAPHYINKAEADALAVVHYGQNLQKDLTKQQEYVIADVLGEGSTASEALKAVATMVQKFASGGENIAKNTTSFKLVEGGKTTAPTQDRNGHYQYFSLKDMKDAQNNYDSFKTYWTVAEGDIPVWAK